MNRQAFTLIELLVVVAIISILASIAMPNFIEAQTRAKVARAKSDLRTLAFGVDCYYIDAADWPFGPNADPRPNWRDYLPQAWPSEYGQWYHLTTPIAYLTTLPRDLFARPYTEHWNLWRDFYRVWNITHTTLDEASWGYPSAAYANMHGVQILMSGNGPDAEEDIADGTAGGGLKHRGMVLYDPTNGTVSWGDIYFGLPGFGFELQSKMIP